MRPGPGALAGCAYSAWVAQRRLATGVKDCTSGFSTNVNNKPKENTNTCTQRVCPGKSSHAAPHYPLLSPFL